MSLQSYSQDEAIDFVNIVTAMEVSAVVGNLSANIDHSGGAEPLVYSISISLAPGQVLYKYLVTAGIPTWDLGEWDGGDNRLITVLSDTTTNDTWAVQPQVDTVSIDAQDGEYVVTFTVDMAEAMVGAGDNAVAFNPAVHRLYIAGSFG